MKPGSLLRSCLEWFLWPADSGPKVVGLQIPIFEGISTPPVRLTALQLQPSAELHSNGLKAQRGAVLSPTPLLCWNWLLIRGRT